MNRMILTWVGGFLLLGGVAWAPEKDPAAHVSHLLAGTVRYVKGKHLLLAGGQGAPGELIVGHRLEPKDIVRTGRGDRLEIMLQPGGYLRLVDQARLEVLNTGYRKMHFRVSEGTVVVDSTGFKSRRHAFKLSTPTGDLEFLKDGFYRIQVKEQSSLEVAVHSGKLNWLKRDGQSLSLTDGKRYVLRGAVEHQSGGRRAGQTQSRPPGPVGPGAFRFLVEQLLGKTASIFFRRQQPLAVDGRSQVERWWAAKNP